MKDGNVLIIVIGGNISQLLGNEEGQEPRLMPASADQFYEQLIENDGSSSVQLHEHHSSKGKQIRVKIERLIDDTSNLEQQDSSQVNPVVWSLLAEKIKAATAANDYEGIVVLHGLDTLAYTASAISFMVRNLNIPIVFTGSQRPLNYLRSDAKQNIYTALTIAASRSLGIKPINEVTIYLHDTLYRANRATMSSASSYRSFDSLNYPSIATVGEHIDVKEHLIVKPSSSGNVIFFTKSDANVQIIDVFPGMSSGAIASIVENDLDKIYIENLKQIAMKIANESGEVFDETEEAELLKELDRVLQTESQGKRLSNLLPAARQGKALEIISNLDEKFSRDTKKKVRGVILRTYGMGTAPTSPEVLRALSKVVKSGIIVMNVTQAHSSRVSFNSDPVSLRLFEQGVISGLDMTSESAFAKMVVILSDERNTRKGTDHCEDELQIDIAGEQSHTVLNYHFLHGVTKLNADEDEYSSILEFKNRNKDFILRDEEVISIDNIQLRILGLRKQVRGASKAVIRIVKCEDDIQELKQGKEILKIDESLENPKEGEVKTVNVTYDITHLKDKLFSKNAVFHITCDQEIAWSRISIIIYC
jgi:L-asparaginase/Glu-tRNA(Gln) amidotransferase subunit D